MAQGMCLEASEFKDMRSEVSGVTCVVGNAFEEVRAGWLLLAKSRKRLSVWAIRLLRRASLPYLINEQHS